MGGFQAGVILAAAFALLALVYGLEAVQRVLPLWFTRMCAALGVLIFAGVGVVTMLLGHNYLGYNALAPDPTHPEHGQHYGILLVELGVLVTVFRGHGDGLLPLRRTWKERLVMPERLAVAPGRARAVPRDGRREP